MKCWVEILLYRESMQIDIYLSIKSVDEDHMCIIY